MTSKKPVWDIFIALVMGIGIGTLVPSPPKPTITEKIAIWEEWEHSLTIYDERVRNKAKKKASELTEEDKKSLYQYSNRRYEEGKIVGFKEANSTRSIQQ